MARVVEAANRRNLFVVARLRHPAGTEAFRPI